MTLHGAAIYRVLITANLLVGAVNVALFALNPNAVNLVAALFNLFVASVLYAGRPRT